MKKIYIILAVLVSAAQMSAQCGGGRFHDFVFPGHTLTSNIVYGSNKDKSGANVSLKLDLYEPQGDTSTMRPLVIVAHGGSFVGGGKTGNDVAPLCMDLARLGYVAASIDYRLGMTHFPVGGPPDSADAGAAVMRAVQDGRAAVRFFMKNVVTGSNSYKIDTNNIFFAGVSAGGFIALHLAYMDEETEFPAYVDTVGQYGLSGGIQGQSGNPGYRSDVKAIVNICGAIGDTAWIHAGDEPLLSFHGTNDNTVPFGSEVIFLFGTYPLLEVDGSSTIAMRADQVGLENCFDIYWGQDHVPHQGTSANAVAYYDTTLSITRNFLEHQVCGVPLDCSYAGSVVGVNEYSEDSQISLFPNPTSGRITADLSSFRGVVSMVIFDSKGGEVMKRSLQNNEASVNTEGLVPGLYLVKFSDGKSISAARLIVK